MLKRALTHLKFELLANLLDLPKWQVVGLLESLWLFAQYHAIDGDLSNFKSKEIAAWMQWRGDAEKMVSALVESGWLDQDEQNLVIHDWQDHCPNWLKGALKSTLGNGKNPVHHRYAERTLSKRTANALKGEGKGTKNKKKVFVPPTRKEVADYAAQRNSPVDPKWFHDYYSENNWHDSHGTPVENWKLKFIAREPEWRDRKNGSSHQPQIPTVEVEIDRETDAPPRRRE
ncbi:MAG: hypothetical protein NXI32_17880 [bacterium]|nr:hypothetical protein [bacterium]